MTEPTPISPSRRPLQAPSDRPGRRNRDADPDTAGARDDRRADPGRGRGRHRSRRTSPASTPWSPRYIDTVTTLDVHSPAFAARVDDIRKLGDEDVRASASVSSRLLDKPLAAVSAEQAQPGVGGRPVAAGPAPHGRGPRSRASRATCSRPNRILGIIPFGNRLRDYFGRYQSSQSHIDAIIRSLYHGQDELQKDNADIEQEKVNLWQAMARLRQYAYMAQKLDEGLAARIAQVEATDPQRAKELKDDLLFPVRQKHQDLLTQLAVSVQGYLALDLIRRNNLELIKGVDRATTTTVSALRTAIIVAQALADQKLVLTRSRPSTRPPATSSNRRPRCCGSSRAK